MNANAAQTAANIAQRLVQENQPPAMYQNGYQNPGQEEEQYTDSNNNKRKYESDAGDIPQAKRPTYNSPEATQEEQGEKVTEQVTCPETLVGKLIGRHGETIQIIEAQTKCKVQVHHKEEGDPKKVSITGTLQGISEAKALVNDVLYNERNLSDVKRELECPQDVVGRIIGKQGDTIRALQQASGARIHVDQNFPDGVPRKINIQGRLDCVQIATQMVNDLVSGQGGTVHNVIQRHGKVTTLNVKCPKSLVGRVIGKGGQNIKELTKSTRANIQIKQDVDPCLITITGPEKSAYIAQQKIQEVIGSSGNGNQQGYSPNQGQYQEFGMAGGASGGPGGQYVPQPFNQYPSAGPYSMSGYPPQVPPASQAYGPYSQYYPHYQPPAMQTYNPYQGYTGDYQSQGYQSGTGGQAASNPAANPVQQQSDWQELVDASGRPYYYNRVTNQSQWEKPADF